MGAYGTGYFPQDVAYFSVFGVYLCIYALCVVFAVP